MTVAKILAGMTTLYSICECTRIMCPLVRRRLRRRPPNDLYDLCQLEDFRLLYFLVFFSCDLGRGFPPPNNPAEPSLHRRIIASLFFLSL